MEWVRWYHGTTTDPKWRAIARRSGQRLTDVLSVWAIVLETASQADERGTLDNLDPEDVAAALDLDTEQAEAILDAMQGKVLDGNRLTGWDKRNPKREDSSAERVRRYRERRRVENRSETSPPADVTQSNAGVTQRNAPEEDRDTEEGNTSSSLRYEDGTPERPAFENDDGTLDAKAFRAVVIPLIRSNVWQGKRPPAVATSRYSNWNEGREANICLQWVKEGTATAEEVVEFLGRFRSLSGIRDGPTSLLWLNDVDGRSSLYELLHEVRKNAGQAKTEGGEKRGAMSLGDILKEVGNAA